MATYTDGQPTDDAAWFCKWLGEAVGDFRMQKALLDGMHYAVFGLGNSLYEKNYNKVCVQGVCNQTFFIVVRTGV